MQNASKISAIHHITAITAHAAGNLAFYRNILGLRLVKKTVNFDDPYTYHLYYGDDQGTPGTILTFFAWEDLPQGRPGSGLVTAVAFAVPAESVDFWERRLAAAGTDFRTDRRFGDPVIRFSDPDGLPIELIGTAHRQPVTYWEAGPLPRAHAITGFYSATATLQEEGPISSLLTEVMGMVPVGREGNRMRFGMDDLQAPGHYYDVVVDSQAPRARPGSGSVHHIAFRTDTDAAQLSWQTSLRNAGLGVTDVRDRKYFHSIYFNSPGGVLFEIATDGPGFAVDESPAELGSSLQLPAQYQYLRTDISKQLPSLGPAEFKHVVQEAPAHSDDGGTLVTLHGSGGSERDLLGLASQISPTSAVISPRGRVLENNRPRFFSRLANNVFDEKDVMRRAHQLADFLLDATHRYGRKSDRLTALGYSNGANMAAAVMLLRPEIFTRAVLLRPMLPIANPPLPDLQGKKVLILRGSRDSIIPSEGTDRLVAALCAAGADVTAQTIEGGHEIMPKDIQYITDWLSRSPSGEGSRPGNTCVAELV